MVTVPNFWLRQHPVSRDLARKIAELHPNTDFKLSIVRYGDKHEVDMKLGTFRRRVIYCRRELERFLAYADLSNSEGHRRALRKLRGDLDMAELDAPWAAHKLEQAQLTPAPMAGAEAGVTDA